MLIKTTQTMKYFDVYKYKIDSGEIEANKWIKLAIKRVSRFKRIYKFRQEEADRYIDFIENECSKTKGDAGRLKLALPQKVWLEVAFGFYSKDYYTVTDLDTLEEKQVLEVRRLINEVPLVLSRGSGKTTVAAAVGTSMQIIDGEQGADIQLLAYDKKQAGYLSQASSDMKSVKGSVINKLWRTDLLHSSRDGIIFRPTMSRMSVVASNYEALDGSNCQLSIFDEVHTYDEDFIKVATDGSRKKRKNWMAWYPTTNGTKRGGTFDLYFKKWTEWLLEEETLGETERSSNDHISPWIYMLDDKAEIYDETKWQKAIPLLGITTSIETIRQEILDAKNDPVAQNEIMAKTFNLPQQNFMAYFSTEEIRAAKEDFNKELFIGDDYRSARCIMGIDLSDVNDICSISFMVVSPDGEVISFINRKYLPRVRVEALHKDQHDQYLAWSAQDEIVLHDHDYNDQKFIFQDLAAFISKNKLLPVAIGYDPWNGDELVRLLTERYGDITTPIRQGSQTLSVPLKMYKAKIKAGKVKFNDPVSEWCHGNTIIIQDNNANIKPDKAKSKNKIDVMASQLDAWTIFTMKRDELMPYFTYD